MMFRCRLPGSPPVEIVSAAHASSPPERWERIELRGRHEIAAFLRRYLTDPGHRAALRTAVGRLPGSFRAKEDDHQVEETVTLLVARGDLALLRGPVTPLMSWDVAEADAPLPLAEPPRRVEPEVAPPDPEPDVDWDLSPVALPEDREPRATFEPEEDVDWDIVRVPLPEEEEPDGGVSVEEPPASDDWDIVAVVLPSDDEPRRGADSEPEGEDVDWDIVALKIPA